MKACDRCGAMTESDRLYPTTENTHWCCCCIYSSMKGHEGRKLCPECEAEFLDPDFTTYYNAISALPGIFEIFDCDVYGECIHIPEDGTEITVFDTTTQNEYEGRVETLTLKGGYPAKYCVMHGVDVDIYMDKE